MHVVPTLVLPGLDGGTRLLTRFRDLAPQTHQVTLLDLPADGYSYPALADRLGPGLAALRGCLLIAESFSGPLAIRLAASHPQSVAALVLVASFVSPPAPAGCSRLPWPLLFRLPLPLWAMRRYLLGPAGTPAVVSELRRSIRSVPAGVLASRVREVLRADMRAAFKQLKCPILYLRPSCDALIPQRCQEEIRQLRADAMIQTIPGPHLLLETQPEACWQRILEFTASRAPRRDGLLSAEENGGSL